MTTENSAGSGPDFSDALSRTLEALLTDAPENGDAAAQIPAPRRAGRKKAAGTAKTPAAPATPQGAAEKAQAPKTKIRRAADRKTAAADASAEKPASPPAAPATAEPVRENPPRPERTEISQARPVKAGSEESLSPTGPAEADRPAGERVKKPPVTVRRRSPASRAERPAAEAYGTQPSSPEEEKNAAEPAAERGSGARAEESPVVMSPPRSSSGKARGEEILSMAPPERERPVKVRRAAASPEEAPSGPADMSAQAPKAAANRPRKEKTGHFQESQLLLPGCAELLPGASLPEDGNLGGEDGEGEILEKNPLGWGPETTPPGRVRFLHFYTWSSLPLRLVSLRDFRGHFIAPGCFAALQVNRASMELVAALRQAALQNGIPLYVHMLFVPVVYPDPVAYGDWQRCTNPYSQSVASLQFVHPKVCEAETRRLFGDDFFAEKRFSFPYLSTQFLKQPEIFARFFADPANAACRGIIWRDAISKVFGRNFPKPGRLVSYAVLRPEWIVDARPVGGEGDLLTVVRRDAAARLTRLARILVLDSKGLRRARESEERRQRDIRSRGPEGTDASSRNASRAAVIPMPARRLQEEAAENAAAYLAVSEKVQPDPGTPQTPGL